MLSTLKNICDNEQILLDDKPIFKSSLDQQGIKILQDLIISGRFMTREELQQKYNIAFPVMFLIVEWHRYLKCGKKLELKTIINV